MKHFSLIALAFFAVFMLFGCETFGVSVESPGSSSPPPKRYEKKGPPPHAPAHGYRHKHYHGHELEYDTSLGAYIVLNIPDTYFANDLYIRMSSDGKWIVSATLDGGWQVAAGTEVPPRLWHHGYKDKSKKDKKNKHKKHKYKKNKYDDDNED